MGLKKKKIEADKEKMKNPDDGRRAKEDASKEEKKNKTDE